MNKTDNLKNQIAKNIFKDYIEARILSNEAWERFDRLKIKLTELGVVHTIVDGLSSYDPQSTKFGTGQFKSLVDTCRNMYSSTLYVGDGTPKEEPFTAFVQEQISKYARSKQTYEKVKDKDLFWKLVKDIENHL